MHPAFSVLFFTTLSGAGYGLLAWTMLLLGFDRGGALLGVAPALFLGLIGTAAALFTAGLLSSLGHLGQPQRAWRALSQWRSSWLSREGVLAVAVYVPVAVLAWWLSAPLRGETTGAGLGVAPLYYSQPMLPGMALDLGASEGASQGVGSIREHGRRLQAAATGLRQG